MAGTSAAGMLAGCGGQKSENPSTAAPNSVTTIPPNTNMTGTQGENSGCDMSTVEPDISSGSFELWHARQEGATRLLQGTKNLLSTKYGLTMKLSKIPSGSFQSKLKSAIPAGTGPQMFQWAHDVGGSYYESDFLAPQSDLRVDKCVYTETAWQAANYKGKTIGLPWAAESPALIYNKDILDDLGVDVPTTFDEWKSVMDTFKDEKNKKYGLGYPIDPYFSSWAAQAFGEEIYNGEENKLGLASDKVVKGLNLIFEDLKPYMPKDPSQNAQAAVFNTGKAPFLINGPWAVSGLQDKDFDFGVAPIPKPSGGQPRPYMGVKLMYFAKKMKKDNNSSKAAREFAEWYTTSDRRLLNLANNGGFIPVKSSLAGNDQLPGIVKGFSQQVKNGYPMPQNPNMSAVWGPYGTAVTNAFNAKNPDVKKLMKNAEKKIKNSDAWSS